MASRFVEDCGRCGVSGLTSPCGRPFGLKGVAVEWVVVCSFFFFFFGVSTQTVLVPDSFGPPAMTPGRTRGYVTTKKKKKITCRI